MKAAAKKRAAELRQLAELVAQALTTDGYVPTLDRDPAMADAFDAGMKAAGKDVRAWRGSGKKPASGGGLGGALAGVGAAVAIVWVLSSRKAAA